MRRHSPAGTTLIELLVALSLLSLMAVLLLGGMRLGLRVWDVGGDRQVFEQRWSVPMPFCASFWARRAALPRR
jgi:Type II secretory pathway, pseudopilin PulG